MKNIKKYPVVLFFCVMIYAISIADLFSPVKDFSETENRKLSTFPKFTLASLIDNKFTPKVETFTEDHFIARDKWITIKSISESILGKKENNGVIYGKDGYLFTKHLAGDYSQMQTNVSAINKFSERHSDRKVTFLLVPTAPGVMTDKVIQNSPVIDTDHIIDYTQINLGNNAYLLDLRKPLKEHNHEYIYYRTDHHWTTRGAYYAYNEYMSFVGRAPKELYEFSFIDVPDFLGTHYSKSKNYNVVYDTLSYIDCDAQIIINEKSDSIYDYSKLEERDKYAMFLRGNNGLSTINGNGDGKIMIIKDSYANCFVPFLIDNYYQIDVYDLRYITVGLDKLIEEADYDEILFLYNCESFIEDTNIPKINLFNN